MESLGYGRGTDIQNAYIKMRRNLDLGPYNSNKDSLKFVRVIARHSDCYTPNYQTSVHHDYFFP